MDFPFSDDSWVASEGGGVHDYQREREIEEEEKWEGECYNRRREERRSPGIAGRSTESSEMQRF